MLPGHERILISTTEVLRGKEHLIESDKEGDNRTVAAPPLLRVRTPLLDHKCLHSFGDARPSFRKVVVNHDNATLRIVTVQWAS